MRAFLAIEPDEATLHQLRDDIRQMRAKPWGQGVRWVGDHQLHLTLRFLGDVVHEQAEHFAELIGDGLARWRDCAPFRIVLSAPRPFPRPSHPRVIARVAQPEQHLGELANLAERSARSAGLPPEHRPFNGHITLGRLRRSNVLLCGVETSAHHLEMRVFVVALIASTLTGTGPIYQPLERFMLQRE
jgi:2'-5' RNA ligase